MARYFSVRMSPIVGHYPVDPIVFALINVIARFIMDHQKDQEAGGDTYGQPYDIEQGKGSFLPKPAEKNVKLIIGHRRDGLDAANAKQK